MLRAMNELDPMLTDIKSAAKAGRIPISRVMQRAGLRPATWSDWMNGMSPTLKSVRAVQAALADELASRAA